MKTAVLVLAGVVLVSLSFVNATTSMSSLDLGTYDPWADMDGDGDINIYDVVDVATAYGTTGDPTRNVTVTNFPRQLDPPWKLVRIVENLNLTWEIEYTVSSSVGIDLGNVSVAGYSRMVVFARITNYVGPGGPVDEENLAEVDVHVLSLYEYGEENWNKLSLSWIGGPYPPDPTPLFGRTPSSEIGTTVSPKIRVWVQGTSYTWSEENRPPVISCLVSVSVYLRNE